MREIKCDIPLKKCPFCGGEAKFVLTGIAEYVQCTRCKAKTGVISSFKEAAEAWNSRQVGDSNNDLIGRETLMVNWNTSMYDHPPVRYSKRPRAYETRSVLVLMRDGPGNLYVGYYDWFTKLWYTADGLNIVYVNGWRELNVEDWAAIQKISPGWKCDGIPDVPGTGKNKKRIFGGFWEWAARRNRRKRS